MLKRGTLRRKEKKPEKDVSCRPCLLPIWPPAGPRGLRPATQDGWTLALPPARHTWTAPLEPCPPITSPESVPALENQLWLFGPLGTGDTPSGTPRTHKRLQPGARRHSHAQGTHTCTARYWVTESHTNRFTPDTHRDRHPKTHGHSHTQVSQTRQNTQTRTTQEGTEQQAYTGTHECILLEK